MSLAPTLMMLGAVLSVDVPESNRTEAFEERDGVMLRVTEPDLNAVLRDLSAANGWSRFTGDRAGGSRGVYDLRYDFKLSQPQLSLDGDASELTLGFDILEMDVNVGRIERRVGRMPLRCENIGIRVDPVRPVDVELAVGLDLVDGELRVRAGDVAMDHGKRDFRLIKPTRCRVSIFPRTVAWWLGKPYLRRRLSRLDELLHSRVERFATEFEQKRGLLRSHWDLDSGPLVLQVSRTTIDSEALSLSVDVLGRPDTEPRREAAAPPVISSVGSHIALSESLVNSLLTANAPGGPGPPRPARGNMHELLTSESVYTLIPGLRDVPDRERLRFGLRIDAPPRLTLAPHHDPSDPGRRARVGLAIGSLALEIFDEEGRRPIGELRIVSGEVDVAPYVNRVAGVSLEVLKNVWVVEGHGIEQDEALIAAMLQELVFGQLFETRYDPLVRDGVVLANTGFLPTAFRVVDGYLVVDLAAGDPVSSDAPPTAHAKR